MTHDFDAARRAKDPSTFTAFGRKWTLAALPSALMREYLVVTDLGRQWELADLIVDAFVDDGIDTWQGLVANGQEAKPAKRATKGHKASPAVEGFAPLDYGDKKDLILWAYKQTTGRPTGRFANS